MYLSKVLYVLLDVKIVLNNLELSREYNNPRFFKHNNHKINSSKSNRRSLINSFSISSHYLKNKTNMLKLTMNNNNNHNRHMQLLLKITTNMVINPNHNKITNTSNNILINNPMIKMYNHNNIIHTRTIIITILKQIKPIFIINLLMIPTVIIPIMVIHTSPSGIMLTKNLQPIIIMTYTIVVMKRMRYHNLLVMRIKLKCN